MCLLAITPVDFLKTSLTNHILLIFQKLLYKAGDLSKAFYFFFLTNLLRPCSDCQPNSVCWHIHIVSSLNLESLNSKNHREYKFCKSVQASFESGLKCDTKLRDWNHIYRCISVWMLFPVKSDFKVSFFVTWNATHNDRTNQELQEHYMLLPAVWTKP